MEQTWAGVARRRRETDGDGRWVDYAGGRCWSSGPGVRLTAGMQRGVAGNATNSKSRPTGGILWQLDSVALRNEVRVAEVATGGRSSSALRCATGRWLHTSRSTVVQKFASSRERRTRGGRLIEGFFGDAHFAASFFISPDGTRLAIAAGRESRSLMLTEAVAGAR